jgi:hypothetical protein
VEEGVEHVTAAQAAKQDGGDAVDFASRQAARRKMQLWLAAFTVVAALVVLALVSLSVVHHR